MTLRPCFGAYKQSLFKLFSVVQSGGLSVLTPSPSTALIPSRGDRHESLRLQHAAGEGATETKQLNIIPDLRFPFFFFFVFLGQHLQHMEVPRLVVQSELQLPAYTTATAVWDPSRICNLHHGSQQCRILNPLSKAGDRTRNLMDSGRVHYCCATKGIACT